MGSPVTIMGEAKELLEEPYALMRASTDLWEPWAGNRPGPPGTRYPEG